MRALLRSLGAKDAALCTALLILCRAGLDGRIYSWISHYDNQRITRDEILHAVPLGILEQVAENLGASSTSEVAERIACELPIFVDKVTLGRGEWPIMP